MASQFPFETVVNVNPAIMARLDEVSQKFDGAKPPAVAREILDHFTGGAKSDRVTALLAKQWPDTTTEPGMNRTSTLGVSLSLECATALQNAAKGRTVPSSGIKGRRTEANAGDIMRQVLEKVLLSQNDRVLMAQRKPRTPKVEAGKVVSIYVPKDLSDRLNALVNKTNMTRSLILTMAVHDLVDGTNMVQRAMALPPYHQPKNRTDGFFQEFK